MIINNTILKDIAKASKLTHLVEKDKLTYSEYMSIVYTEQWQKRFNELTHKNKELERSK